VNFSTQVTAVAVVQMGPQQSSFFNIQQIRMLHPFQRPDNMHSFDNFLFIPYYKLHEIINGCRLPDQAHKSRFKTLGIPFLLPGLILYLLHKQGEMDKVTSLWALDGKIVKRYNHANQQQTSEIVVSSMTSFSKLQGGL